LKHKLRVTEVDEVEAGEVGERSRRSRRRNRPVKGGGGEGVWKLKVGANEAGTTNV